MSNISGETPGYGHQPLATEQARLEIMHTQGPSKLVAESGVQSISAGPVLGQLAVANGFGGIQAPTEQGRHEPMPELDHKQMKKALESVENAISLYAEFSDGHDPAIDALLGMIPNNWRRVRKDTNGQTFWLIGRRVSEAQRAYVATGSDGRQVIGLYKKAVVICVKDVQPTDLLKAVAIERHLQRETVRESYLESVNQKEEAFKELSEKELQVVQKLFQETRNIAAEMDLSESGVSAHLHNIYKKVGVKDMYELVMDAVRVGILSLDNVPAGRTHQLKKGERKLLENYYGSSQKDAARGLGVSATTIHSMRKSIYGKLESKTPRQAMIMGIKDGLIPLYPGQV